MIGIELDDDLLSLVQKRGRVADPGRQVDPTTGCDFGGFDDREVHPAQESLHGHLGHVREVHVHEVEPAGVGEFPQGTGGHVRSPPTDRLGQAELVVTGNTRRSPAEHPDLKRTPRRMQSPRPLGEGPWHRLGGSGRREPAHSHHRSVGDQLGSLFGCQRRKVISNCHDLKTPRLADAISNPGFDCERGSPRRGEI